MSPTPRAALALAAIGVARDRARAGGRRAARGRARRRAARRRARRAPARRGAPTRARRSSPAASPRRSPSRSPAPTPATLRVRQPRPRRRSTSRRKRATAASTRKLVGRRRGSFTLPAAAVRVAGPLGLATCDHRAGEDAQLLVYPDLPVGAPARARRAHGALPRVRPPVARPARPRHRVRVDPRLPARRRHPPGQLAGDRAHGAADEQPVPHRAGPRRHLRASTAGA